MYRRLLVFSIAIACVLTGLQVIPTYAQEASGDIVVSELQTTGIGTDGADDGMREFIELHNQTQDDVGLNGWRIQYFSASREDVFDESAHPTREISILNGSIGGYGYVLLSFHNYLEDADIYFGEGSTSSSGLLAKSGGHIRILRSDDTIADVLAWGTAKSPETKVVAEIDGGYSAARISLDDTESLLQDSNDNSVDFQIVDQPDPLGGSLIEELLEEIELIIPPCNGVIISELMPNPEGIDVGNEFIELYNPTEEAIQLEDCELSTSSSKKVYLFPINSKLDAKSYIVLTDSLTGLVLNNSSGGHVLLTGTMTEFLVQYPAALDPDHTWAILNDVWLDTDRSTPGSANLSPTPEPAIIEDQEELAACPAGKYRNPETNRCRNIQETAATLIPCSQGQVRNPETNRCRSIGAVVAGLVPCREGQERNPETNRCRNVLAANTVTPCQAGYERNPETNRCRKIQAVVAPSPSVGSASGSNAERKLDKFFIVIASTAVLGYGLYEYRRDAGNAAYRIRQRFIRGNTVK